MLTLEDYMSGGYFKVEIRLQGCDDETCFVMEVTLKEYLFLKTVAVMANNASEYCCQPRMHVKAVSE